MSSSAPVPNSDAYSRYVLALFVGLGILNVLDRQVLATLIEPIKAEFDISDLGMGLLSGAAFTIVHIIAAFPVSRWADHANRRSIIAAGLFAWSALTAATGLAQSYVQIFLARMGVGIGETVGGGPTQSLVSDYFPPERRAVAFSVLGSGGVLGSMLGFGVGGWLAETVGWRWTFVCFGVPGVALALLIRATVAEPARGALDGFETPPERSSLGECFRYLLGLRSFNHVVISTGLNAVANYTLFTWSLAFLMRTHGLSISEAGVTLSLAMSVSTALGLWASGFVGDRLGRRDPRAYVYVPAVASCIAMPLAAGFLLASDLRTAVLCLVPSAFFGTMWLGNGHAVVQGLARPNMRATAAAMSVLITSGVGFGIGPVIIGWISDRLAPTHGDAALGYALLVGVLPYLWSAVHNLLAARTLVDDLRTSSAN
ncbi:MFS transporter [Myxococcota bacterium]|nr:MFS transporter [Myxococcota bacterium]